MKKDTIFSRILGPTRTCVKALTYLQNQHKGDGTPSALFGASPEPAQKVDHYPGLF